jgi:CheY-like chemotaxis protein
MVVEDQYMIAAELRRVLHGAGLVILGPYATLDTALAATSGPVDLALLDVNLDGLAVFPVADALAKRGVPYGFATAYEAVALPPPYDKVLRVEKPVEPASLLALIETLASKRPALSDGRQGA